MHTQFFKPDKFNGGLVGYGKKRINILFQSSESISPVNFVLISTSTYCVSVTTKTER